MKISKYPWVLFNNTNFTLVFDKTPHLHRQGEIQNVIVLFAKSQLTNEIKILSLIVAVVGLEPTTFRL